jgi:hypothetical protein
MLPQDEASQFRRLPARLTIAGAFSVALLSGCSDVGPGLAHHPLDCAIGFPWADCLAGTPGYNNGGGQETRAEEARQKAAAANAQRQSDSTQCVDEMRSPELDPIRSKVELVRQTPDAPPFEIASIDAFPSGSELPAIAKWAKMRDACMRRAGGALSAVPSSDPLEAAIGQQRLSFGTEAAARVSELILALYHQKLTYGEFAQKRYEVGRDAASAERQFDMAVLLADQEHQRQAKQLAQQQFQNSLLLWSSYMQNVNARQPRTVHLDGTVTVKANCMSQRLGTLISTNCN